MEYLKLGKIIKPHGLKGEVKIFSSTDFGSTRYQQGHVVFVLDNGKYIPLKVHSYYKYREYDVVSFEDYLDINKLNNLLGKEVYIDKEHASLPKGYYHYQDLVGLKVIFNKQEIGKVTSILHMPANDILRAKTNDNKTLDIPFVDEFILNVNLDKKEIEVNIIEGMLWK